jgi:tetratricopeptide (TPR) repeat protein
MKTSALLALVLAAAGCGQGGASHEYDRQVEVCSVAEANGLLEPAARACGAALAIAERQDYPPDVVSGLLYRLARLERQRERFEEAETLIRRSLQLEEQRGGEGAVAARLIELSLTLAGQDRWREAVSVLERAAPLVRDLTGDDRRAAANAYRGFSVRLRRLGLVEEAERLLAEARELTRS